MSGWFDMTWREPVWLWLALIPWLMIGLRRWLGMSVRTAYADSALLPWAQTRQSGYLLGRRYWRYLVSAIAWLLLAAAMAGPRQAQSVYTGQQDHLPELMIVLDVSHSMTARDIQPTRLQRARLELYDLVSRIEGWRIGLVLYAAHPHLLLPPSRDKSLLRYYLQLPRDGLLPTEGTDLLTALRYAAQVNKPSDVHRTLLLLTDGDTSRMDATYQQSLQDSVTTLRQQGVTLYILGVGTAAGAPLLDQQGGWLEYQGKPVVTHLQRQRLEQLARLGGGNYATVRDDSSDWQSLYDNGIARDAVAATQDNSKTLIVWHELFGWFLMPGIVLLLLANWQPRRSEGLHTTAPLLLVGLLSTFVFFAVPGQSYADNSITLQQAYQAFKQQDYRQAQHAYRMFPGYAARMGEGSSAYHLENYTTALQQFTLAVLAANTDAQRADALFNLGNSYYQLNRFSDATVIYQDVLRYRTGDVAVKHNLQLAQKLAREQLQQQADGTSGRQGRGPRIGKLDANQDLSRGSMTLDNNDKTKPYELTTKSPATVSDQAEKQLDTATLADDKISSIDDRNWDYAIGSTQDIAIQDYATKVDQSQLWQRLFESEEGVPAALERPQTPAGIRPW